MIMPSDKTYRHTKQIMLGNEVMNADFKPLAEFINKKFKVKVINIIYDTMDSKGRPRLEVCFEFEGESNQFNTGQKDRGSGFDKNKQQIIAEQFAQLVDCEKYNTKNIWVFYSAFDKVAKIEANEKVSAADIEKLQKQLSNNDIWTISRLFTGATFFLYTDEQVRFYENSPVKKEWTDRYFEVLKTYDEFDYFKRDSFSIRLDSKENFDTNYNSNWWYYYK